MAFLNIAPTGTVLPFAGSTAPEGWAICNGAALNRTNYATLFAVVSTTYGTGDGSTTFNLPDMQGVFPRGAGTNGTGNYGGATGHTPAGGSLANKGRQRTAPNSLANVASAVSGTANGQSFSGNVSTQNIPTNNHFAAGNANGVNGTASNNINPQSNSGSHYHTYSGTTAASSLSSSTAAAQTISGDAETTPAFLALNYIIKL